MRKLYFSRDLKEVCEVRDTMTADEALQLLCDELLGDDFYIVDPVGGAQANAIIAREILKWYAPKKSYRQKHSTK